MNDMYNIIIVSIYDYCGIENNFFIFLFYDKIQIFVNNSKIIQNSSESYIRSARIKGVFYEKYSLTYLERYIFSLFSCFNIRNYLSID